MATRTEIMNLTIEVDTAKGTAKIKQFGEAVEKTGKKGKKSISGLEKAVKALGIVVSVGAFKAAIGKLNQLFESADKAQALERAFGTLTKRIGETSDTLIRKLRPASQGLLTDLQLMESANNAIVLGLGLSGDQMADVTKKTLILGRAMGLDAKRAMDSIIVGLGRQSKLWLDNLGILVNTEQAYKDLAKELGVNVSELDDVQRKGAFMKATLVAMDEAVTGLTLDVSGGAAAWKQMTTALTNFSNEAVNSITNIDAITVAIGFWAEAMEDLNNQNAMARDFGDPLAALGSTRRVDQLKRRLAQAQENVDFAISRGVGGRILEFNKERFQELSNQVRIAVREMLVTAEKEIQGQKEHEPVPISFTLLAEVDAKTAKSNDEVFGQMGRDATKRFNDEFEFLGLPGTSSGEEAKLVGELLALRGEEQGLADDFVTLTDAFDRQILNVEEYRIGINALAADLKVLRDDGLSGFISGLEEMGVAQLDSSNGQSVLNRREADELDEKKKRIKGFALASTSALTAAFASSKEIAIANTVVNTALGISNALAMQPPPLGIAMAAIIAASGAVQLAKIRSTNIGGGGGGSSAPPAGAAAGALKANAGGVSRQVQVIIDGQGFIQDIPAFGRELQEIIADNTNSRGV